MLANIVADVIIPLAVQVPALLAPEGVFLCSGIIDARGARWCTPGQGSGRTGPEAPGHAQTLAQMVRERFGVREIVINYIGPVIGAHSGPGTLALFYIGTER